MAKTRREFTPEFKREAVALLDSSGRPQMQIAAELGIQPSMLRQWRSALMGGSSPPRIAGSPGAAPASPVASPSDQAAEIARLRRELDRTRMERDVLERMARPVRKGFVKDGMMVCINVSGLKAEALAKLDIRTVWSS